MKNKEEKEVAEPKKLKREVRQIKHVFTQEELLEIAQKLSTELNTKQKMEGELSYFSKNKKAEIENCSGQISIYSNNISNGYEYRSETCEVLKDYEKRMIFYMQNGVIVDEKRMPNELQEELDLYDESKEI